MPATELFKDVIAGMLGEGGFAYIARGRELAKRGYRVVNLSIGQPDAPTPGNVIEEAVRALREEKFTGYTETTGIPELREAIADYLNERYGSDVKPDEVIVGPGAKGPLFLAIAAYLREGDEVIVPEPAYPAYAEVAKLFGAKPVYVTIDFRGSGGGFALNVEALERALSSRTRAVVINNPHNPTGAVFSKDEIDAVVEIARKRNILIIADEIYDNFVYEGRFESLITHPDWRDWLVYVNGFSKTFSMTGWRLGYMVVKREVAQTLRRLAVNIWGCPASFVQKAGVRALRDPETWVWVKKLVERYRENRDLMYSELSRVKYVEVWRSRGAFYMFPRVTRLLEEVGMSCDELVEYLIDNYQLVLLPGTAFSGQSGGNYLRFSFTTSRDEVFEGVERFRKAVEELLAKTRR